MRVAHECQSTSHIAPPVSSGRTLLIPAPEYRLCGNSIRHVFFFFRSDGHLSRCKFGSVKPFLHSRRPRIDIAIAAVGSVMPCGPVSALNTGMPTRSGTQTQISGSRGSGRADDNAGLQSREKGSAASVNYASELESCTMQPGADASHLTHSCTYRDCGEGCRSHGGREGCLSRTSGRRPFNDSGRTRNIGAYTKAKVFIR